MNSSDRADGEGAKPAGSRGGSDRAGPRFSAGRAGGPEAPGNRTLANPDAAVGDSGHLDSGRAKSPASRLQPQPAPPDGLKLASQARRGPAAAMRRTELGPRRSAAGRPARRRRTSRIAVVAVVFLIVAAVVGGFLGGNAIARQRWAAAIASGECLAGPAPEEEGAAAGCVGLLRIPRFGDGWTVPIRGDTSFGALGQGVGWVAGTTAPGQIGNCVIVGQRLGAGQPFFRLRELEAGDLVEVETASHIYVYALDIAPGDLTVTAKAAWVLDPVPGASDLVPQTALLSLVTAQDLLRTGDRSVGVAVLLETREK